MGGGRRLGGGVLVTPCPPSPLWMGMVPALTWQVEERASECLPCAGVGVQRGVLFSLLGGRVKGEDKGRRGARTLVCAHKCTVHTHRHTCTQTHSTFSDMGPLVMTGLLRM